MALRGQGLIITADDFGLRTSVNLAVEQAFRHGVLSAASLMVGAGAALDAIERAHANPGLAVGLHLVLADGRAVLPRTDIPDLVDEEGNFGSRLARDGMRFFLLPHVRRQLAAEIRAQFEAFARTGLPLDHVNAHKHLHLHPTVLAMIVDIGRPFGLTAVRLPREQRAAPLLRPWLRLLERKLDAAGIAHNDYLAGLACSGRFDEPALLHTLDTLPTAGIGELYLHPALESGAAVTASAPAYRHADEFAALVSPRVCSARERLRARGFRFGGFADLAGPA